MLIMQICNYLVSFLFDSKQACRSPLHASNSWLLAGARREPRPRPRAMLHHPLARCRRAALRRCGAQDPATAGGAAPPGTAAAAARLCAARGASFLASDPAAARKGEEGAEDWRRSSPVRVARICGVAGRRSAPVSASSCGPAASALLLAPGSGDPSPPSPALRSPPSPATEAW